MNELGETWGVEIRKSWRLGELWILHCFPYNLPNGRGSPPYPGFTILKEWLAVNCKSAAYETFSSGSSAVLEVTFNDPEEAMMFRLKCG